MSAVKLDSGNFDETIAKGRTLVDFWAGWCMPCRMVAPVIEELAEEFEGSVAVGKVDVDSENALAARFGVASIPTVILFSDGVEIKRFVGVQPKATYQSELRK